MIDLPAGDNQAILDALFSQNAIRVRRGKAFDSPPQPRAVDSDRMAGMMLGLAIGDALGNTSESQNLTARKANWGEIRDYLPNKYADKQPVGVPSDDSQMAFWTLEQLIEDGTYVPDRLAERFCIEQIFGIGSAVKKFVTNYRDQRIPWYQAGTESAGNGALMRIAAMLFPHVRQPSPALWADVALSTMTTHNDCAAISSSIAFVALLNDALGMDKAPAGDWWVERFLEVLHDLDDGSLYAPRGGAYAGYGQTTFPNYVQRVIDDAFRQDLNTLDACEAFYSGAYLLETVPCVLYILKRHGDDPEEAIVRAVNDTRDNDTIGAIVGAAVGVLHGKQALPKRWLDGLTGRTGSSDDGRMFELIALAEKTFLEA